MNRDPVELDEFRHDKGDADEGERSKAIQHYFNELLKDPDVIWESISEVACSSDEEAAKRVADIAEVIKLHRTYKSTGQLFLSKLADLILAADDYITGLAIARYDAEGAPE